MFKNIEKKHINLIVILLYSVLVIFANLSLLTGNNLMKWDIFDAHYPYSTFVGDALKCKQLPLWNPMIKYGTPHYAVAGMPVWYPISLILALIGYSPLMMGVEYSLHMIIAGYGMFMLIKEHNEYRGVQTYISAIICGIFYMFSTVFISNAQHIMIFSSATWIPYVMLYLRKYIIKNKYKYLLTSGFFSGLIILGGYPEILIGMFICILPYILNETFICYSEKQFKNNFISSIKTYLFLAIFTVLSAFVTIVPFGKSLLYITRGIGSSIKPQPFSINAFLTAIIPGISNHMIFDGDISMVYCYMGLFTVVTLIAIIFIKPKNCKNYLLIATFIFLMIQGDKFYLYPLFHKYFPLFGSLRFPSVWRCLLVIFILIPCSSVWNSIDNTNIKKIILKVIICMEGLLLLIVTIGFIDSYIKSQNLDYIYKVTFLTIMLLALYIPIFCTKNIGNRIVILILIVCIESLTFQFFEFPVTVATFPHKHSEQEYVKNIYEQFRNRNKDLDFKDAIITNTPLIDTRSIIFNRTIDEGGYMSFTLSDTQKYIDMNNRMIVSEKPKIYFTNNIVYGSKANLENWLLNISVPNNQIYLISDNVQSNKNIADEYNKLINEEKKKLKFKEKIKNSYEIINPYVFSKTNCIRKLKLNFEDNTKDIELKISFLLKDGTVLKQMTGKWKSESYKNTIIIDFPQGYDEIEKIDLNIMNQVKLDGVEYILGERLKEDKYIDIEEYKLNQIKTKINIPESGYIVLKQAYYPGWKAYIDGKKVSIDKVNGIFIGIPVEAGLHDIKFKFMPMDFFVGALISLMYLIFTILIINLDILKKIKFFRYKKIIRSSR